MTWGAVGVAGATVAGGLITNQQQAQAQAEANAASAALAAQSGQEQRHQFDVRTGELSESRRAREDAINRARQQRFDAQIRGLDPFAQAGRQAIGEQSALLGLSGGQAQEAALGRLTESPGQAFLRERQERALLRNASRIGGLGGGNVRTALQEQAFGRAQTDLDRQIRALGAVAGQGQQAAARQIGDPGFIQTGVDVGVRGDLTPRPPLAPIETPDPGQGVIERAIRLGDPRPLLKDPGGRRGAAGLALGGLEGGIIGGLF